jgi:hypothetical protein
MDLTSKAFFIQNISVFGSLRWAQTWSTHVIWIRLSYLQIQQVAGSCYQLQDLDSWLSLA